jgi:transposase, IS5 family
LVRC